jgi:cation diffusion facilitator CzcD-associated flavoprotein CzcO
MLTVSSAWKWPNIPGLEKFKLKEHSAAWDHSISLKNKVVGVIGNGSSAIQIVPAIFPGTLLY